MSGAFKGAIWGVIAIFAGMVVLSVVAPPPVDTVQAPTTGEVQAPAGSEFTRPAPEGEARLPGTDATVAAPEPSAPAAPAPDTPAAGSTQAGDAPAPTTSAPGTIDAPKENAGPDAQDSTQSATPTPQTTGPQASPAPDAAPGAVQQPDAPLAPVPEQVAPDEGSAPTLPGTTPDPRGTPTAPPALPDSGSSSALPQIRPQPSSPPAPSAEAAPEAEAEAAPEPGATITRLPVPGHEIRLPDVRTGRLPTVGGSQSAPQAEASQPDSATLGALARYGAPFERSGDSPLFSIVLIDSGADGLDRATLTTFSFPVTFAVDPTQPDAVQAVRDYRAAGFEVVLLVEGLPEGAAPKDVEVTLGRYIADMPETVALVVPQQGDIASDRPLLRQLMDMVADSGHGVLTFDRGLNTARQLADGAGVPAAQVFRELDADQESAPTIRRYLDRAVFKAGQDGQVIMIGHSYPETVTALFKWALEGPGGDVTLAPLSAILRGQ